MMRARDGFYCYAKLDRIDDYLRLGWCVVADLGPTHGRWSALCFWPCGCKVRVPS
jgi:hypothetical protein